MEVESQNSNPSQVQNQIKEQIPSLSTSNKSKLKIPIILVGVSTLLIIIGILSAVFFLPKSNTNNSNKSEVVVSHRPSATEDIGKKTSTITSRTKPTPTSQGTPTPIIINGASQQGDLTIKYIQKTQSDNPYEIGIYYDIHLSNSKTHEDKIIGQTYYAKAGELAVFSKDLSQVIFIQNKYGGDEMARDSVSFYSISQNKVTKVITLGDIKAALPSLTIPRNAALYNLILAPTEGKIAINYGYTPEMDSESDMIIIDVSTFRISTVGAKGVLKAWIDDKILQYSMLDSNSEDRNIITKEVVLQ